jgi:antitoxin Phd
MIADYMTTVVTKRWDDVKKMREIQLRDAKASLSAVVDEAVSGRPAVITRRGKREAVVLSFKEWQRLSRVPSFGRLLMSAPVDSKEYLVRNRSPVREVEL